MVDANACDIEIFGRPAGRLVADGNRFVFYAADQTFWNWAGAPSMDLLKSKRRFTRRGYGACTGVQGVWPSEPWSLACDPQTTV